MFLQERMKKTSLQTRKRARRPVWKVGLCTDKSASFLEWKKNNSNKTNDLGQSFRINRSCRGIVFFFYSSVYITGWLFGIAHSVQQSFFFFLFLQRKIQKLVFLKWVSESDSKQERAVTCVLCEDRLVPGVSAAANRSLKQHPAFYNNPKVTNKVFYNKIKDVSAIKSN